MNKVIELYTETFKDLGLLPQKNGRLQTRSGKEVSIDGGRIVVLPLETYLIENNWEELFPWHPLSENEVLGPSTPILRYSNYLKVTTHGYLVSIIDTLIKLVQQPELQEQLKGTRLIRILSELPKISDNQVDEVRKAVKRYFLHLQKEKVSPITIRLSRVKGGKTDDGIRATRKATILSNYTAESDPASYHVHCTKLSKKALDFMERLFEITELGTVLYGDGTAPYYQSLLKVHKAIIEKLRPYLSEISSLKDDINVPQGNWFESIDDLKAMSLEIVSLPGNEGVPLENASHHKVESDPLDEVSEPKRRAPQPRDEAFELRPSRDTERTTARDEPKPSYREDPDVIDEPRRKRGEVDLDVMDAIRFIDNGRGGHDPYLDGDGRRERHTDRYVDDGHRDDRDYRGRGGRGDRYHETDREREDRLYYEELDRRDREEEDRRYREERRGGYRDDRGYRDDYRDDRSGGHYPAHDPYVDDRDYRDDRGRGGRGGRR